MQSTPAAFEMLFVLLTTAHFGHDIQTFCHVTFVWKTVLHSKAFGAYALLYWSRGFSCLVASTQINYSVRLERFHSYQSNHEFILNAK